MPKKLEQPTAEMVIEAGRDLDDCPEVKRAFTKLWPGAFKDIKLQPGKLFDKTGNPVAWVSIDGTQILFTNRLKWKFVREAEGPGMLAEAIPTRK